MKNIFNDIFTSENAYKLMQIFLDIEIEKK
jgi:hypothetical protein